MVDSCFKMFKTKCFGKSSMQVLRDSRESVFEGDKNSMNESVFRDKKPNFDTDATSIDNAKRARADCNELDFKIDSGVVLRRHNRCYLRSISTTVSTDAMSSDEDDEDENLDILYPLPYVSPHERALVEEANRQIGVDERNGTQREREQIVLDRTFKAWQRSWLFCYSSPTQKRNNLVIYFTTEWEEKSKKRSNEEIYYSRSCHDCHRIEDSGSIIQTRASLFESNIERHLLMQENPLTHFPNWA